jgi:hypothetical protein
MNFISTGAGGGFCPKNVPHKCAPHGWISVFHPKLLGIKRKIFTSHILYLPLQK